MSQEVKKPKFDLNYPVSAVNVNVEQNIKRALPQVQPHDCQDKPIGLICGGPSLSEHADEIKQRYDDGLRLVTVNGSHDWVLDHGMHPSAHVMVDSRPGNARFVKKWDKRTKYLIASQCHPRVFDVLEEANVYIWHAVFNSVARSIVANHYFGNYFVALGGSTVTLRSLSLLRMLGFMNIEIWGFDSCVQGKNHHAYAMPENDGEKIAKVTVGDKDFWCVPWMHSQAEEFQNLAKTMGDELNLIVHGDGLIAHIVKTGGLAKKQEN